MTLGEKIQQLRKENGLSQEMLSEQLEVSRQAISKWELGEATPDTEKVIRISKLFHVSTDYLLLDELEQVDTQTSHDTKNIVDIEEQSSDDNLMEHSEDNKNPSRKEKQWYEHFLGKWVKIFLDDRGFGGFYQVGVLAINDEYLLFEDTDSCLGIVSQRSIKTITEADIYRRKKNIDEIPKVGMKNVGPNDNLLHYFIGKHCRIHLECKSLFQSPGGFYNAVLSDVTEDSILVTYKKEKSVVKIERLLAIVEC